MTAPRRLQLRRGNATAISTYTGAAGEVVIDTTNWILYVHDGSTVGGYATTTNVAGITGNITQANLGLKGYVDLANTIQSQQISSANLGMKGYVDSVANQSIYGNSNVKSYLTGGFNGNILPSANVTYSLGNVTNRWKDLYLSGNTIYLGDATITTAGGKLVTTGAAISPPTGAVGFANVQLEAATDFAQIRSYYVDNNFGYTANLKSWATAPIVWDELRSAKIRVNSYTVQGYTADFESLDISGGRFANAEATLDATGNIASITITDGGVGYDSYYPYYAADSIGYDSNYIGQSYTGSPTGKSFRRIGLIPTTASDVGNITSMGTLTRGASAPTVGSHTYTWTGNTGSTLSLTINWSSNTVSSYTYTRALPVLSSAQDWQNWLLDYQNTNDYGWYLGSSSGSGKAIYDYLFREALPDSLQYDIANTKWYPNGLNVNNSAQSDTISANSFTISFNRTSINYATLENSYGNPVYWSRGLSADTGISSGGDMTVAGDLRVSGDLYVSPTSIYMGDLRISAADGNLKVNTGIKFSDDSVQSTAYSNVQVAAYLTANPPGGSYSNVQVAAYLNTNNYSPYSNVNVAAYLSTATINTTGNITAGNLITSGALYVANITTTGASGNISGANYITANYFVGNGSQLTGLPAGYSNVQVATYLPTYSGNIANIRLGVSGVLTFPDGTTQTTASVGGGSNFSNSNVASYLITNGYINTNSAYGNGNVTSYLPTHTGNVGVNYLLGTTPNVILTAGTYNSTFDTLGNVSLPNVYVQGNVTAAYFIGNGSQLTGLPSSYSNIQTAAYLNSMGYNLYSNVNVAAYMPSYLSSYTGNITAQNITVNGNINLIGNALQINSAVFYGNTGTGFSALYAGAPGYTALPQVVAQFTTNYNGYSQLNAQNLGTGNQASTDFVATANNGNDSTFFLDLGIAGNGYDPAVGANNNALGTVISPNDVYLYSAGNLSTQPGGNIAIGTQTAGKVVKIFAGGVNAANVVLTVANTGITTSNVTANYFIGSGQFLTGLPTAYSNVNVKAYTESMGFQNYGNANVASYLITNGYVNTNSAYSNVNAKAYADSMGYVNFSNVNVAAYVTTNGLTNYSNVNTKAYTESMGLTNYSNVNVASYLSTATINTTGNITAQNISGNISITGNVTGTSANVTLQAGSYSSVFDNQGNVRLPSAYVSGNVVANYFTGNGALLTGLPSSYSNVQVATYLPTYSGNIANIRLGVSGVLTFADGTTQTTAGGSSYSNVQVATYLPTYTGNIANIRLGVSGVLTFADGTTMTSAAAGTYSNVQVATYLPTYTGSINAANILVTGANITLGNIQATTAATNTATGALRVMGGVGVAGSLFAAQLNTTGNLVANTVSAYSLNTVANVVASVVNAGTINSAGNVLAQNIIGTIATASQTGITAVGTLATLNVTGNATVGNLIGTEANTRIIANVYTTTFDIYGNVSFPGNVNVAGLGVVMPARPAFRVNGTGLVIQTPSANVNLKGAAISVAYNQGSYFNATTGIFTAPIAGLYQASINCRIGTNNGLNQVGVLKNGTITPNPVCWWETDTNTGTAVHFSSVGTVQLAVGDWLSANIVSGNISFDGNDNWCVTYLG